MTGQDIKNSILQLAIQGKLVPQDANDEPASELLKRIRKEKEQLVQDGKLKKKDLVTTPISDEEKPFDIPESWEWCRLGEIADIVNGFTPLRTNPEFWDNGDIAWFTVDDIHEQGRIINKTKQHINAKALAKNSSRIVPVDTLLLCCTASVGEYALTKIPLTTNQQFNGISIRKEYKSLVSPIYLFAIAPQFKGWLLNLAGKTTFNFVSVKKVSELIIPLPPLAEQHRIVEKIEALMPNVEKYDKAQNKLNKLNKGLPEQLKQSILQEAIMGKLGTQDPNDEPASVLLKRIRKEKEQLIKDKKIKKEKPLPEIKEEDKPFDIPESWEWCRLQTLCQIEDGDKKKGNYICMDAKYLRGKSTGDTLNKGKYVEQGEKIILVDGENSGEVFTCPIDGYLGSTFKKLWISEMIFEPFIIYLLRFHKDMFRNSKKGAAIPHLNKDIFRELLIPLPPLVEQHRIVEKVEALLGKIERIKK